MSLTHIRRAPHAFVLALAVVLALAAVSLYPPPARAQAFSGSCAAFRGSFTGTLTGYASPSTGTVQYRVTTSCQVTLWLTAAITGTSNAATMTMTGLPYSIQPASANVAAQLIPNIVQDNGAFTVGCVSVPTASGTLTFSNTGACAGAMTSSAAKGLPAGWTVSYTLY